MSTKQRRSKRRHQDNGGRERERERGRDEAGLASAMAVGGRLHFGRLALAAALARRRLSSLAAEHWSDLSGYRPGSSTKIGSCNSCVKPC